MVEAHITELLVEFPGVWLWLDAVAWYPRTHLQSLYNRIKIAGNENTLVILNYDPVAGSSDAGIEVLKPNGTNSAAYPGTLAGTSFYLWPFDVASFEYGRIPGGGSIWGYVKSHLKHVHWGGSEVTSPLYTTDQWFYRDPVVVGGSPNALTALATLETRSLLGTANNAPFCIAISPKGDGSIPDTQRQRLKDLGAYVNP
jgi:hypothetical protein